MKKQPLAEVFGYPIDNMSADAVRCRSSRLCPFGNKVPNCTKDKANNPLGVCSVIDGDEIVITCPVRFRQKWLIAEDAAKFFFPPNAKWTTLTEVRLKDRHDKSAGNIDVVLVSYDDAGRVTDFGALEVQAVYISGNIRNPFEFYMDDPQHRGNFDWSQKPNYPNPDYLSSSRKRLAPQLIFKGGILHAWKKKTAVALNVGFYNTLPQFSEVSASEADIAWLVYELRHDVQNNVHVLDRYKTVYTNFNESLEQITKSESGDVSKFLAVLQQKVDDKLNNPPETELISATF